MNTYFIVSFLFKGNMEQKQRLSNKKTWVHLKKWNLLILTGITLGRVGDVGKTPEPHCPLLPERGLYEPEGCCLKLWGVTQM